MKTSSLGDILQTFPVITNLKRVLPTCSITWVVEKGGEALVRAHPLIDEVIVMDSKKWRKHLFSKETWREIKAFFKAIQGTTYDFLFDFQGNIKSSWVTYRAKALRKIGFGKETVSEWPNLFVTSERYDPTMGTNRRLNYLHLFERVFGFMPIVNEKLELKLSDEERALIETLPLNPKPILVSAGSMWKNKTLPKETLLSFLKEVQKRRNRPFLFSWGSAEEKQEATFFAENLGGTVLPKVSIPLLQRIMGHSELIISADSLPLHLAGTTGVPTFSYFGPSNAVVFRPLGDHHTFIQGPCPYGELFVQRCPHLRTCKDAPCLQKMTVTTLMESFPC